MLFRSTEYSMASSHPVIQASFWPQSVKVGACCGGVNLWVVGPLWGKLESYISSNVIGKCEFLQLAVESYFFPTSKDLVVMVALLPVYPCAVCQRIILLCKNSD